MSATIASRPTAFDIPPTTAPKGWLPENETPDFPTRFAELKAKIISEEKGEVQNVVNAWNEIITELAKTTEKFNATAQENIPSIEFADISTLSVEQRNYIKRHGCVVIRNVVDDEKALEWKKLLQEYIDLNPQVEGFPSFNKQFFELYWSRSQLEARAHPNVLAVNTFLNEFFHVPEGTGVATDDLLVDLSSPLAYADRFRIRKPNRDVWTAHAPHIDGGSIEKWEDEGFRDGCYRKILDGKWMEHDAYDMRGRLIANTDKYGRPNQSSVFRTWQGWLAMSNTGPGEGTLRLFPDVLLSNSYLLLRPFFSPIASLGEIQAKISSSNEAIDAFLAPSNWRFDNTMPDFPGIAPIDGGKQFSGQKLNPNTHPHLRLDRDNTMISVPRVLPGDMVFWHCDAVHSVETLHNGSGDSSVMYIPAVPLTPNNLSYIVRQREHFLSGLPAPDYPQNPAHISEARLVKKGTIKDIGTDPVSLRAMGVGNVPFDIDESLPAAARKLRDMANRLLYPKASA